MSPGGIVGSGGTLPGPDDDGERCNILIVDDLPEKLLVFGTVLEDLGQNLILVRSGNDALREVLRHEFAVILLDVNMPDIDGFETASLIRQYNRSAHTPIIFVTAYADEMQTARGYSLGAVDYILSPVIPEMLRSKVKVFVDLHLMQKRARRQAEERVALIEALTAQRVAEDNERRSKFLAEASRQLSASLDAQVGMQRLIELVVPAVSRQALLMLVDQAQQPVAIRFGAAPVADLRPSNTIIDWCGLSESIRQTLSRALEVRQRIVARHAGNWLATTEATAAADQTATALPLVLGSRCLGVLLLAIDPGNQSPGAPDWAALDELASRAAIAFENGRLYASLQGEIVERTAAQAESQQANRRKDEFLAMLSHELRNPLAPIRNAVEVLRRIGFSEPRLSWAIDVMERQTLHLAGLVDDLLDVARISQGKITLNRERVDLNAVIAHSVETAQPLLDARRLVLVVDRSPAPVWLWGDFARLSQVVSNLLHNAAKFSEDSGQIELRLTARAGEAHIVIRDHGIGIEESLMPRIFDLFAQGEQSLDRSKSGLGVGLTLVRRLVDLHGGTITASSDGAGKGAQFDLTFPCVSIVGAEAADPPPFLEPSPPVGQRILIVDDNQDAADSIAMILKLEGHDTKVAHDVTTALDSIPMYAPHVVLLDIGLPVIDGYEGARRMRLMDATREALIIAVSGYGQPEDRQRALEAGFDHHLVKPTDPLLLLRLIADWRLHGRGAMAHLSTV